MPTMGNHRRIAGVVGCEFSRIGPSPQNRKAKILKWGRIGKKQDWDFHKHCQTIGKSHANPHGRNTKNPGWPRLDPPIGALAQRISGQRAAESLQSLQSFQSLQSARGVAKGGNQQKHRPRQTIGLYRARCSPEINQISTPR